MAPEASLADEAESANHHMMTPVGSGTTHHVGCGRTAELHEDGTGDRGAEAPD